MISREREHLVDAGEVRFIGFCDVVVGEVLLAGKVASEGENAVIGAAVLPALGIIGAGNQHSIHMALNP